jgi:phosphate transport system substrate-binding protein
MQNPSPPSSSIPLTYEGATTIGTMIMPEATSLFESRTGIKFGTVGGAGARQGFTAARDGKATFGGVARALTDEEKSHIKTAVVIGYDVMGVFVNGKNPVKGLSRVQVKGIFTGKITNWKQVGGADRPIVVYSETLTGGRATVEAFKSTVLAGEKYGPLKELDDATDCLKDVAADAGGVTASSMSFAIPGATPIAFEGSFPTRAEVQQGRYPLKRPLLLVTNQPLAGEVKQFLDFMVSPEAQELVARHFVPAK